MSATKLAEIGIIVPTRGRPNRLEEMHQSWRTHTEGRSRIVAVLDDDDTAWYPPLERVMYEVVPQASFADKLRDAVGRWSQRFEAVASWNDDHVAHTPWEEIHLDALNEMGGGIVYGNDLVRFDYLPTAPTISMNVIDALGWICPPGFRHMYIDDFWKALGTELGRYKYLPETVIEHAHADVGRSERDETYDLSAARADEDALEWKRYMREDFAADLGRVREALDAELPSPLP